MSTETEVTAPTAAPERKPRWYRLTPERFIWAVLFLEIFLWISDRCRWFAFNEKKGWTILIAMAALGLSLLWFSLWFLSAWVYRRRFQFGIRMMLVLTIAVAIPFSWLKTSIEQAKGEQEIAAYLKEKFNCHIGYRESLQASPWLSKILGENFSIQIYQICQPDIAFSDEDLQRCYELSELESIILNRSAITDAGLENIGNLTRLKYLELADTLITDAGLKHLAKLHALEELDLTGTNTTEAGVQELQAKLPHCKISW